MASGEVTPDIPSLPDISVLSMGQEDDFIGASSVLFVDYRTVAF